MIRLELFSSVIMNQNNIFYEAVCTKCRLTLEDVYLYSKICQQNQNLKPCTCEQHTEIQLSRCLYSFNSVPLKMFVYSVSPEGF